MKLDGQGLRFNFVIIRVYKNFRCWVLKPSGLRVLKYSVANLFTFLNNLIQSL